MATSSGVTGVDVTAEAQVLVLTREARYLRDQILALTQQTITFAAEAAKARAELEAAQATQPETKGKGS